MTVSNSTASQSYTGDGSTTAFPTVFVFNTSDDIEVIERVTATGVETTKTLTTDYTVTGGGGAGAEPATGTVSAVSAPASTVTWTLRRVVAETQTTDLPTAGAFPSAGVETQIDRVVMMVQQHTEELGRGLSFPKTDSSSLDPTIPSSVDRASMFLAFDSSGNPIAAAGTTGSSTSPVSSFMDTVLDDETAAAARTTLGAIGSGDDGSGLTGIIIQGSHSIWVPATAMTPTVSNGCAPLARVETTAGRPDMNVLDFDASADEHAQFSISFPKSWNEGTITFQAFHTTTATDTDGVAWGLQGVACSDGDTIDVAYGTAVVVTDAYQSTAEDMYVTSISAAVTIAGTPAAGDGVFFRMFRDVSDAADTATEDARLIGVKILYTVNAGDDS